MTEHIDLDVPLDPRFASTVRAVAASVGAELGFSVDDIDDLRLGVNEAVSILTDVDDPSSGRLHVRFEAAAGTITVRCTRTGAGAVDEDAIDVLARRILDAVVDDYSVDAGHITVTKRLAGAAGPR